MVHVKSFFGRVLRGALRLALVVCVCALIGAGVGYVLDAAVVGAVFGGAIGVFGFVRKGHALSEPNVPKPW